ncbi:MAG TPA: lysylphosphatidylglycerol synthase domain-containing protein [Vicinamibacterales bacterium]|nr:lysylphosphatidylglycerol synthase domain-containing protein [Vicinamibacterales bacterium]
MITIRRVGWIAVQDSLRQVGWWFVVVLALGALRFAARARAWMACVSAITAAGAHSANSPALSTPALSTQHFWKATLASDALGNLTPLGFLASEPAKILFVRNRLSTVTAIVSVAAENAFYMASVVVMLTAGAAVFIALTDVPAQLRSGVQAVFAGAVLAVIAAFVIARRRPAVLSRLARLLTRATGRAQASAEQLEQVESHFYGVLAWPATRLLRVIGWEGLFHVAAVAEVYLVLGLLPGGDDISLSQAFVLETTGRLIAVVFKMVPYRVGVDEAGGALVAGALLLNPAAGVTLALVRRIRIFFWNAVGLAFIARTDTSS